MKATAFADPTTPKILPTVYVYQGDKKLVRGRAVLPRAESVDSVLQSEGEDESDSELGITSSAHLRRSMRKHRDYGSRLERHAFGLGD
jgi:hypothetical protein